MATTTDIIASPITINAATLLPLKLTSKNFAAWHLQIVALLEGLNLFGYIDGSYPCPPPTITVDGADVPNPAHAKWKQQDRLIYSAIIGSLSENLVTTISKAALAESKAAAAWTTLTTLFANKSRSRVMTLKDKISHISKGSNPVADYLQEIQQIADELALIGHPLDDLDIVIHALSGLGPDYKEIIAALKARDIPITFEQLFEKLLDYERFLKKDEPILVDIPIATANVAKKTFHPRPRQRNNRFVFDPKRSRTSHQSDSPLQHRHSSGQFCEKPGHTAKTCYKILGRPPNQPSPIVNFAHVSTNSTSQPPALSLSPSSLDSSTVIPLNNSSLSVPPPHLISTTDHFPIPLPCDINPTPTHIENSAPPHNNTDAASSFLPSKPNPTNTHPMTTRSKNNIFKPKRIFHSTKQPLLESLEPTCVSQALKIPHWKQAMSEEFMVLLNNGTWDLVPPSSQLSPIGCKWIFKIKRHPDGSISRYKARLVAKGFHQMHGVNYFDTFSPVIRPQTIKLVLSIALAYNWPICQMDVNNAFLQGTLHEEVYMQQPPGFIHPSYPSHVFRMGIMVFCDVNEIL
ncbi:hypothetical protein L6164_028399 [Bauhinia variegata]|uniref:Uncharacterized protein n=1 Tax=Bauhinia variegata TaxID=167791 RepID=A0ACB9L7B6_BAUVA|nr:hypothetical protein L6164_028399 [Bauhinia variegata]